MKKSHTRLLGIIIELLGQLVCWAFLIIAVYNGAEKHWDVRNGHFTLFFTIGLLVFASLYFYLLVYLILPQFKKGTKLKCGLAIIVIYVLWCIAGTIVIGLGERFIPEVSYIRTVELDEDMLTDILIQNLFITVVAIIYFVIKKLVLNGLSLSYKLQHTNAQLMQLRNQVNPHFLFNTLNNFYSMAIDKDNAELADGIAQLTHLMRYNIYESKEIYVSLAREIDFLNDYIKLQKLRFTHTDDVEIVFDHTHANGQFKIASMLLISFVENAFKHGISLKNACYIHISIQTHVNEFNFSVINAIHNQPKQSSVEYAGFGINHVKSLLKLQYPNRHSLEINEENNRFTIMLKLKYSN